jgi:acyl-CoA synthetase (AMP-forming)/AMP-acid ligase II
MAHERAIVSDRGDFLTRFRDRVSEHGDKNALVFLADSGSGVNPTVFDYAELDRRARRVAAWLGEFVKPGDRAMLLFVPGPQFMVGFLGCLYAGVAAIPAPMPDSNGRGLARLGGIARDADVRVVLSESGVIDEIAAWVEQAGLAGRVDYTAVDTLPEGIESSWQAPPISGDTIAFLQYTSGSTSEPKGVMITRANLLHNEEEISRAIRSTTDDIGVGWLPQFHDMGLIGQLLHPLYMGATIVFMSPLTFLKRPYLWLWAITEYRATISIAPNFAFELATRRITDKQLATLDLSSIRLILNGSEPIQGPTIDAFTERFTSAGLHPDVVWPCYGLAETTLFVTGSRNGKKERRVDPKALERNEIVDAVSGKEARTLISSGSADRLDVRIVDPQSFTTLEDGRIGEIWVRGNSVAAGYWNQPTLTEETFHAVTDGEGGFLRTGDLGALVDGELYVTGRLKDMLVINGRNLYPHDIEHVARQVHPALQAGVGATFVVGDQPARLVLVHEIKTAALAGTPVDEVVRNIRAEVRNELDLHVSEVVLLARGGVARTTSGKVRRGEMRTKFLAGELKPVLTPEPAGASR